MELLVFTYNKLLNPLTMQRLISRFGVVREYMPAFTYGRIFRTPKRCCLIPTTHIGYFAYGTLYKLICTPEVFKLLDAYHGCSKYLYGDNLENDFMIRKEDIARTISFDSINNFIDAKYTVTNSFQAVMYKANPNTNTYKKYMHDNRNQKVNCISEFLSVYAENKSVFDNLKASGIVL